VAQQVGDVILKRFGHVDFVFGTHNVRRVPAMIRGAAEGQRLADIAEDPTQTRFDLPGHHMDYRKDKPHKAFLTVMEGCDMFCSFCIVPLTRGREISRTADAILEEARQIIDRGAVEITLLGQTVNAYGRHDVRRDQTDQAGTMPFAELLGHLDQIPGLERLRYTSPHPLFYDAELIAAHRDLEKLCPHVHLPVQSGSNSVLAEMRRRYDRERYLEIVAELREARPDLALTSDLIVGFPGETESDFEDTLDLIEKAGFIDSFSFKYSPRPGTQAADASNVVPPEEAQRRLEALQQLQRAQTLDYHRSRVGTVAVVLTEGPSKKGDGQICGRDPYNRVVNLDIAEDVVVPAGLLLTAEIVEATPHSLLGIPSEARQRAPLDQPAQFDARAALGELPGQGGAIPRNGVKSGPGYADEQDRCEADSAGVPDPLRVL